MELPCVDRGELRARLGELAVSQVYRIAKGVLALCWLHDLLEVAVGFGVKPCLNLGLKLVSELSGKLSRGSYEGWLGG